MNGEKAALVAHGGCGSIKPEDADEKARGMQAAVKAGALCLQSGESALEAVVAAVAVLEDHPLFNAGTGSALTFDGEAEMDASLMLDDHTCGAVAAVRSVRHPIWLARMVMEKTDHVMLVGEGAMRFARLNEVPVHHHVVTPARRRRWQEIQDLLHHQRDKALAQDELEFWKTMAQYLDLYLTPEEKTHKGTVGAVARDQAGRMAAATSTGGIWFKLPGRVGDTPILGAGTWATDLGAVSATGHGEGIIRYGLSRTAVEAMASKEAQAAVDQVVEQARQDGVELGLIGVDARGGLGWAFNSPQMAHASWSG
ncbi:MAG TPA: isoaspartyl peptidase/L-asparaginase family protein [Candidatus Xenobia bacterium]